MDEATAVTDGSAGVVPVFALSRRSTGVVFPSRERLYYFNCETRANSGRRGVDKKIMELRVGGREESTFRGR